MNQERANLPAPLVDGFAERLRVRVYASRPQMGAAAAAEAADVLREAIATRGGARAIFASAASQNELLASLKEAPGIDWGKVTAFHMDEYLGENVPKPQQFGQFLKDRLFAAVQPGTVHYLNGQAADPQAECDRYARLLREAPIDLCCLGIGETGHLAFNDPPVADFADPEWVKVVEIDEQSRIQQVHDGAFARVEDVPRTALTLTLPALLTARRLIAVVPGATKSEAVARTLAAPLSTACPATILRQITRATLYLDSEAFSLVRPGALQPGTRSA